MDERLIINPQLCRGCLACALACALFHEGCEDLGRARLRIRKDLKQYRFDVLICRQCESQECVQACPVDAIAPDGRGVLVINPEDCIQCQACLSACPYEALFYDEAGEQVLKCDYCASGSFAWDGGPLCARICPVGAIVLAAPARVEGDE
jgi:Fe-S-cluster-containing dehydrogenase component